MCSQLIFFSSAAITMRVLPVKSSAPAMTTRIRPMENMAAPKTLATAKLRLRSALT